MEDLKMKRITALTIAALLLSSSQIFAQDAKAVKDGSVVKFNYTLYVDGQVADTSEGKEPLEYTHGSGMIIPGLEAAMVGLKEGEEKHVEVAAAQAYGEANPQAIVEVPKKNVAEGTDIQAGMVLQLQTEAGQTINGIVQEIKDETLVMNFNHPLAGKNLVFDVKVVSIN